MINVIKGNWVLILGSTTGFCIAIFGKHLGVSTVDQFIILLLALLLFVVIYCVILLSDILGKTYEIQKLL